MGISVSFEDPEASAASSHAQWNPKFSERRFINYSDENESWMNQQNLALSGEDKGSPNLLEDSLELVRMFMIGHERFHVQRPDEPVSSFCHAGSIAKVRTGHLIPDSTDIVHKTTLLIENAFLNGEVLTKKKSGALTAPESYKELSQPRYVYDASGRSIGRLRTTNEPNQPTNAAQPQEIPAGYQSPFRDGPFAPSDQPTDCGTASTTIRPSAVRLTDFGGARGRNFIAALWKPSLGPLAQYATSTASNIGQALLRWKLNTPWISVPDRDPKDLNADCRIMFVMDLDADVTLALIATASYTLAPVLRDALCKYLSSRAHIDVTFTHEGMESFHLALHISYFVWRSTKDTVQDQQSTTTTKLPKKANEDHRRDADGRHLRKRHDVSFLDWRCTEGQMSVYEAQVSCVIAGSSIYSWQTLAFAESYFDHGNPDRETVEFYTDSDEDCPGDPCTAGSTPLSGKYNSKAGVQDPRLYFLMVWHGQLSKILGDWKVLVKEVQKRVKRYEEAHQLDASSSQGRDVKFLTEELDKKIRSSKEWIMNTRSCLHELLARLETNIHVWEGFRRGDIRHFGKIKDSVSPQNLLQAIAASYYELQVLHKVLQATSEQCNLWAGNLELRLNHYQSEAARGNKGFSLILMFCSPAALTMGLFSMDKEVLQEVLPFMPHRLWAFVVIFIVFTIIITIAALRQKLLQLRPFWGWISRVRSSDETVWFVNMVLPRRQSPKKDEGGGLE